MKSNNFKNRLTALALCFTLLLGAAPITRAYAVNDESDTSSSQSDSDSTDTSSTDSDSTAIPVEFRQTSSGRWQTPIRPMPRLKTENCSLRLAVSRMPPMRM